MQPDEEELPLELDKDAYLYAALDAIAHHELRIVSIGLGVLFVILAIVYVLTLPSAAAPPMVTLAICAGVAMFGLGIALGRFLVPVSWSQPIGVSAAGLVLLNSLLYLYIVSEPRLTMILWLLIVGAGLFFLSASWLSLTIVATLAGWGLVVWLSPPSPDWLYFGIALFLATVMAIIIHTVRLRTVLELITLRLDEGAHKAELEDALASTEEARRLAEKMNEVGLALTGTLELSKVLALVLDRLAEIVPYDRGSVMLLSGDEVEIVAARGFPEQAGPQIRISVVGDDNDIFRQIYLTQRPLSIPDVSQRPDFQHVEGLPRARSWLGVPLIHQNAAMGMLSLARESPLPYSDDEIMLATAFAGQAAIGLQNARLYDDMKKAYDQLERLDRTKSDFIGVASHELRTPLTSLRGSSQILLNDPAIKENPLNQELVSTIYSGAVRLHEIVDSMLDMIKIDSRALQLYPKPLSVSALIQTVCNSFARSVAERNLTLTVEDIQGLPEIEADLDALRKVFRNLVVNAIKYTPDGGMITISGRAVASGEKDLPEGIQVVVSDTGIGIAPESQELIFTKFYQTGELALHSTSKTQFKGGGPGLGLAIAQGIVEAHGGKLWVESPGFDEKTCPGSKFYVFLPLRQRRQVRPPADQPER